jgi:hypothetical protein
VHPFSAESLRLRSRVSLYMTRCIDRSSRLAFDWRSRPTTERLCRHLKSGPKIQQWIPMAKVGIVLGVTFETQTAGSWKGSMMGLVINILMLYSVWVSIALMLPTGNSRWPNSLYRTLKAIMTTQLKRPIIEAPLCRPLVPKCGFTPRLACFPGGFLGCGRAAWTIA